MMEPSHINPGRRPSRRSLLAAGAALAAAWAVPARAAGKVVRIGVQKYGTLIILRERREADPLPPGVPQPRQPSRPFARRRPAGRFHAERHALQRLTRQRERLENEVTAVKRRLLDLLRWACPAIEAVLPDLRTNLSLAVLHDVFDPAVVAKARRTTLLRFVAKRASSNHPHTGPFAETLVDGIKLADLAHLWTIALKQGG